MALVAGVDSSTQSCKVLIVDSATGAIVRQGRASHPVGTEIDPEHWWTALQEALLQAGGLDDVAAISIGAQQHGLVALDVEAQVIRPALLWNDNRSAAAGIEIASEISEIAARTGSVPVASFTSTKLRWLRDAEPENAARVAAVALPHDWLTWRLRGFGPENPQLTELATDRSDASGTGYWGEHGYDLDVLAAVFGTSDIVLPRVLGPGESAGTTASGMIVGPGAGDNAGAALGLGAREGDVVVSIGTSGTVFAVTAHATHDATGAVAGFADASGNFLPLVATLNAARVLDSIRALLDVTHDELGALALAAPAGADGLVLQPYFEGERTPNKPDATATLFGMSLLSTSRANLARAAIEGLLCGLADGLDALRNVGVESKRIILIGGAAQNSAVQTIASEVFDLPVIVPAPGEYVSMGAAVQAAWALTGERPTWPIDVVAEPEMNVQPIIREQYATYAD